MRRCGGRSFDGGHHGPGAVHDQDTPGGVRPPVPPDLPDIHGYNNSGATSSGLQEKCPAVSVVRTTGTEYGCGDPVKRHELHFLFDRERYRAWTGNTGVWLDDDPDDDDFDGFRRVFTPDRKEREGHDDAGSGIAEGSNDQCTYISTSFHRFEGAQRTGGEEVDVGAGDCGSQSGESTFSKRRSDGKMSMCVRDESGSVSDPGRRVSNGGESVKLRSGVLPLRGCWTAASSRG